jgi:hypothetical protein
MTDMTAPGRNWRVILTLVISALGILFFLVQALSLGVFWLTSILDPIVSLPESLSIGLLLWTSILGGLLLIPLLLLSIHQLQEKPMPGWLDFNRPAWVKVLRWLVFTWPVVVLLGWLVTQQERLATVLLGPINVLVASIPILGIYYAAQRGLSGGSPVRKWRIFGFSITILPVVVILVELLALALLGLGGLIWLGVRAYANPLLEQEINQFANQVLSYGQDVDALIQFLEPWLLQPSVIFWAVAVFGGIIPIIEEVLKPIAVWTLAGRKITAQEGFVAGLLCGAGFALMENVFYFTTVLMSEEWIFMAIGRAGTGVLHMLASGFVGWGLAAAWQKGRIGFLAITTMGAFIIHGLWNALALVSGIAPLLILDAEPSLAQMLLAHTPVILLLVLSVLALLWINRHLRKATGDMNSAEYER